MDDPVLEIVHFSGSAAANTIAGLFRAQITIKQRD